VRGHPPGRARDLGADRVPASRQDARVQATQVARITEHQRMRMVVDRRESFVPREAALLGLHLQREEPFDVGGALAAADVHVAALDMLACRLEVLEPATETVEMPGGLLRRAHVGEQALAANRRDQRTLELPAAPEQVAMLEADLAPGALLAAVPDAEDRAPGLVLDEVHRQRHLEQVG